MDKNLRIILTLVSRGFTSGVRGAGGVFKGFISSITSGVKSAAQSLMSLTQTIFFVREALNTLAQAGRWVFDTFVKGAGDAAKFEAKLSALTGSAEDARQVMDYLRKVSQDTGADFDQLASGAQLIAVAAKDASGAFDLQKFKQLNEQLIRMAALRPDVPIDRLARGLLAWIKGEYRSLEMFLDQPLRQLAGIEDAAEDVKDLPEEIGQGVTYIETKVAQAAGDAEDNIAALEKALQEMGATQELIESMGELSGLERFQQILAEIARTIGAPIFEALNEELSELSDWFQENPEKVQAFADAIGELLTKGLVELIEELEDVDWEQVAASITQMAQGFQGIGQAAEDIGAFVEGVKSVADWIGQANVNANLAAQQAGQRLGTNRIGEWLAGTQVGQALKLEVHVTSDNDMFDAKVKQISDGAVTDGLNEMANELEEGQQ